MKTFTTSLKAIIMAPETNIVDLITLSKQVTTIRCINTHKRKQNE